LGIRLAQVREDDDLASKDTLATTRKYEYVWDIRYIDAPVLRDENTDEDDLCDDETLYYTTDANPGGRKTSLASPTPAAMRSVRAEARDITVLLDGQRILEHPGVVRATHQGWNQELRHLPSGARFRFVVAPLMAGRRQPPSGTGDCP